MGLIKHGEGAVIRDEDVQKTAAKDDEARQQREAALQQENEEVDR